LFDKIKYSPLGRPTYVSRHGLMFYRDSFFFLLLFSAGYPPSFWTKIKQNRPHARKWMRFENVCPRSGVSSCKWGP